MRSFLSGLSSSVQSANIHHCLRSCAYVIMLSTSAKDTVCHFTSVDTRGTFNMNGWATRQETVEGSRRGCSNVLLAGSVSMRRLHVLNKAEHALHASYQHVYGLYPQPGNTALVLVVLKHAGISFPCFVKRPFFPSGSESYLIWQPCSGNSCGAPVVLLYSRMLTVADLLSSRPDPSTFETHGKCSYRLTKPG